MKQTNTQIQATLCYLKHDGRTLMLHRNSNPDDHHLGRYNGLGGKFLPGETPEECAKREVLEECGLSVRSLKLHGHICFPDFTPGKDWYVWLFTSDDFTGEQQECDEGTLHWIEDEKIMDLNLWPGDRIFLPWLKKTGFFSAKFIYRDGKLAEHEVRRY